MELKVFLLLFLGIGFCFAKPFPGSETAEDNGFSPNSKLKFNLKDEERHLPLGPRSDEGLDETQSNTKHPLQSDDISKSGGHLDPISSFVKDSFQPADLPPNPIPDFITQQKVDPLAFPDLASSLIEGDFQQASNSSDTTQGGNSSTNFLNLSDFDENNVAEIINESITEFLQPEEANATDLKPVIPIQLSVDDVADLVAFDGGDVIPSAKFDVLIAPPVDFEIGGHFDSIDAITENSQVIEEDPLTAILTPLVEEVHLPGTRHVRNAEIIVMNIPSNALRTNLLDNVNVADFIPSETIDKKSQLPKQQSKFDKSDSGSSKTGDDDDGENLELEERFGEDLAFNHSDPYVPSDLDNWNENDTIVFTMASSVLKSFLLGKAHGNTPGVVEKFRSEEGVYPFDCPSVQAAFYNFKHNPITYDDEEDGFIYPTKVAENEGKRTNRTQIHGRPSINDSKGSFFRSLTDEASPIIKSPVNFSELHRREDVKHSNDKFEDIVIKSAVKTIIGGAAKQLKSQSAGFPEFLLFKTLNEEESVTNSTQQEKLEESITDDNSKENINDNQTNCVENDIKKGSLFRSLTDEVSPIIKSPVNFSELHQREDVKHSNDKFEEKIIQSGVKTMIGRVTSQLKPQSAGFPEFLLFKTLNEEENDAKSTQEEKLEETITDDISKENINDNQTRCVENDIKKGSFYRSLTDEVSPIIKSPVNFSELHQREDVKHSNDKFEEKIIQSGVKTMIGRVTSQLKPQSAGFPEFLLFKTLTEEENCAPQENINDNQTRVARSPSKEVISHFFGHVLEDDSLPKDNSNNTNTNSSTTKQEQEKHNGSGHESKQTSFLTSIKERFKRSANKELVSPFFDQVLDDGSLPEEHNNSKNTNLSTPKQERGHREQNSQNESKPKTILRTIIDKGFRISDAVKTFINHRFGGSVESFKVPDETIFDDVGGNPPRVVRSPSKELVSPFFDQVLEDGSLPDEHKNTTNNNSSSSNQDQEHEEQNESNDKESVPKSFIKTTVDESFRISDAVKTFLNDRFGRSPSKELTSSFFDQILEDGSLLEEHNNNTNSNFSTANHENKSHEEGNPSLVKAMIDKTFRISDAVKTSIKARFGRSTGNSTDLVEDKFPSDNHAKQTRVARYPSKEQVSPFFDEVLEDGSIPAEQKNSNPLKQEQNKPNVSGYKELKPISLFKIVTNDSFRISDAAKEPIKYTFVRPIINSTEQYISDVRPDKDNTEVNNQESRDIISEGHGRKRRSVKEMKQDEIEILKEIHDLNKAIIKLVHGSGIDLKKPKDETGAFVDKEWLKEIMSWAAEHDLPSTEKAESLNDAEDIPADFDGSFFINTDHKTQYSEKADSADDSDEFFRNQDSEDDSDENTDQKDEQNNSKISHSQLLDDVLLKPNTANKTAKVHKEVELEYWSDEVYEDLNDDVITETFSGHQKGITDVLNNESDSEFLSFRFTNNETVAEPGTKVNADGEELDDEGHVYPNWNWADQKSRMPDPNAPTH